MADVWTGFEALTVAECRRLLTTASVGRLAVTAGALPQVLPVRFHFDGERLWCQTAGPEPLHATVDGHVVGFEADDLDLDRGTGWCVSVTGTIHLAGRADEDPDHLPTWFADGQLLELRAEIVKGHRLIV